MKSLKTLQPGVTHWNLTYMTPCMKPALGPGHTHCATTPQELQGGQDKAVCATQSKWQGKSFTRLQCGVRTEFIRLPSVCAAGSNHALIACCGSAFQIAQVRLQGSQSFWAMSGAGGVGRKTSRKLLLCWSVSRKWWPHRMSWEGQPQQNSPSPAVACISPYRNPDPSRTVPPTSLLHWDLCSALFLMGFFFPWMLWSWGTCKACSTFSWHACSTAGLPLTRARPNHFVTTLTSFL